MSRKEILAYAITHAPRGQKGGPYESWGREAGESCRALAAAYRTEHQDMAEEIAADARNAGAKHARVIRIVRKARPSEASAVEVLRELVAWSDNEDADTDDVIRIATKARRVLAASGPNPMPVVRAAMRETEAWDAYLAAPATRSRAETEVLDNASRKRFAAVDAYRKAGGTP